MQSSGVQGWISLCHCFVMESSGGGKTEAFFPSSKRSEWASSDSVPLLKPSQPISWTAPKHTQTNFINVTLKYRERDTLKIDHSRATNPSATCKHRTRHPTSHTSHFERVCTKRDGLCTVLQPYSSSPHGPSCTLPWHHRGKSYFYSSPWR